MKLPILIILPFFLMPDNAFSQEKKQQVVPETIRFEGLSLKLYYEVPEGVKFVFHPRQESILEVRIIADGKVVVPQKEIQSENILGNAYITFIRSNIEHVYMRWRWRKDSFSQKQIIVWLDQTKRMSGGISYKYLYMLDETIDSLEIQYRVLLPYQELTLTDMEQGTLADHFFTRWYEAKINLKSSRWWCSLRGLPLSEHLKSM